MEIIDALEQAFQHAESVIRNVRPEQYDAPTPCAEWNVRELLGHTIGVVAGLGAAAAGKTPTEFALADDPAAQLREASTAAIAAWRAPGVLDQIVNSGAGPMPGRILAGINLLDTATHAWDLATATGQPARLPAAVAEAALAASRATIVPEIRAGRFAAEVPAAAGADKTQQLVAFLGRQP